jgi:hypothetical protein
MNTMPPKAKNPVRSTMSLDQHSFNGASTEVLMESQDPMIAAQNGNDDAMLDEIGVTIDGTSAEPVNVDEDYWFSISLREGMTTLLNDKQSIVKLSNTSKLALNFTSDNQTALFTEGTEFLVCTII